MDDERDFEIGQRTRKPSQAGQGAVQATGEHAIHRDCSENAKIVLAVAVWALSGASFARRGGGCLLGSLGSCLGGGFGKGLGGFGRLRRVLRASGHGRGRGLPPATPGPR